MKYNHRDHRGVESYLKERTGGGRVETNREARGRFRRQKPAMDMACEATGAPNKPAERYPRNTYGGGRRATRATDRKSTDCADANAAVDWGC